MVVRCLNLGIRNLSDNTLVYKMIYLFTNLEYGKPFLSTASRLAKLESLDITVVLSNKRPRGNRRIDWLKVGLTQRMQNEKNRRDVQRRFQLPVKVVLNVNSVGFADTVDRNDHGIIAGFNQIFKRTLIDRFKSLANIHPSLLPYYRGPTPGYWCMENGEEQTGFTLHKVGEKIDRGEILYQDTVPIELGETLDNLMLRIGLQAQSSFREYLLALDQGRVFKRRVVNARCIYKVHVDYKSFPPTVK